MVTQLNRAIGEFVMGLSTSSMASKSASRLPLILRVARYYVTVAEIADELVKARAEDHLLQAGMVVSMFDEFIGYVQTLFGEAGPQAGTATLPDFDEDSRRLEDRYQQLKEALLVAGAEGTLSVPNMETLLREASLMRRAVTQARKAMRTLHRLDADDEAGIASASAVDAD